MKFVNLLVFISNHLDNEPPTLVACPVNKTLPVEAENPNLTSTVEWENITAFDNSKTTPEVTCNPQSGSVFKCGVTLVVCEARDKSDNTATCSFVVQVTGSGKGYLNLLEIGSTKNI